MCQKLFKYIFFISFKEGQQVIGKCGGRCGICRPENDVGLKIELVEGKSWIFSYWLSLGFGRQDKQSGATKRAK